MATYFLIQSNYNYDVIIVDDSNDNTPNIIKKYVSDKLKLIIPKVRKGRSEARNIGIKASRGKYIAFLDSDDLWHPKKISIQIDIMIQKNYLFTHTSYYQFHKNKQISLLLF